MNYLNNNRLLPGPTFNSKVLPEFLTSNEKEKYQKDLKIQPREWEYRSKKVYYNLNSHSYRTYEWNTINWNDAVVVFGCSHVFGEGLHNDDTLTTQLQNLINRPVINLGQPGTSTMFSWHNSMVFNRLYGVPYAVMQVWSDFGRLPYYENSQIGRVSFWSGGDWDNNNADMKNFYKIWNKNYVHSENVFRFDAYACNDFWKNKTRYLQASFFKETSALLDIPFFERIDYARDYIHSGPQTHAAAAQKLADMLK